MCDQFLPKREAPYKGGQVRGKRGGKILEEIFGGSLIFFFCGGHQEEEGDRGGKKSCCRLFWEALKAFEGAWGFGKLGQLVKK